jgi:hypothetical protein
VSKKRRREIATTGCSVLKQLTNAGRRSVLNTYSIVADDCLLPTVA